MSNAKKSFVLFVVVSFFVLFVVHVLNFSHLNFRFVSDFVLRICAFTELSSDFLKDRKL